MTTNPEIARRAYEIWEQSGRAHGRDVEHWLRAEAEIRGRANKPPTRAQPLLKTPKPRRVVG
ncbi:MAG TPA: DUF2934 domain-containing protein [Verrucomicrobiae bacterium]|nr:DUF2934 domain-containing protein [Verrucomicrobiae bacterium]